MFQAWLVFLFVTYNTLPSGGMIVDVRLVNGPSSYEGTVEYTTDNVTWQTTCGPNFGFDDARLVCEHIGTYGTNRAITDSPFGSDLAQPTTFLQCLEGHTSISDCGLVSSCSSPDMIGAAACYDDTYLGCNIDATNDRVLPGDSLEEDMTIDKCITHCRESTMADYVYAGVEDEDECYCGVAGTDYTRLGPAMYGDDDCQSQCKGYILSSCGGNGHIAVFQIPETPTTTNGDLETRQGSSSQQPTTTHVTSGEDDDTTKGSSSQQPTTTVVTSGEDDDISTASVLTSNKPGKDSSTTYSTPLFPTTPAFTMQMGETSNLGVAAGAGGGTVGLVIILVVIIVVVVLYKRRHGRAERKGPLPDLPPNKFDASNYDEILMDNKGEPSPRHPYEDCVNYAVVNKEPQLNMGLVKDEEDLSALYAVSTKHRPEPEGTELGDLYAMPDKRKKGHGTSNCDSTVVEPSTQESTPPVTDALYAMPDKKKKATDDDEDEEGTEMVENPIYT